MTDVPGPRHDLDPAADPLRWEQSVAAILAAAEPELARRAGSRGTLAVLESWTRPVLALAASMALLASAALLGAGSTDGSRLSAAEAGNTVAETLVPSEVAAWLEVDHDLSADDFYTVLGEF